MSLTKQDLHLIENLVTTLLRKVVTEIVTEVITEVVAVAISDLEHKLRKEIAASELRLCKQMDQKFLEAKKYTDEQNERLTLELKSYADKQTNDLAAIMFNHTADLRQDVDRNSFRINKLELHIQS